jgi:hypothetical protein
MRSQILLSSCSCRPAFSLKSRLRDISLKVLSCSTNSVGETSEDGKLPLQLALAVDTRIFIPVAREAARGSKSLLQSFLWWQVMSNSGRQVRMHNFEDRTAPLHLKPQSHLRS